MRTVRDWDLSDLISLRDIKAEEGTGLEFKRSEALNNNQRNKDELCKDVSAMANAAGGIIVYGIVEGPNGEAAEIDEGCASSVTKPEWIDQVLSTGVEPKLDGLTITAITLENGNRAFAVDVRQATALAPHQVRSTQRYYRRTNRRVDAMLDYEIRDLMRRAAKPDLYLRINFYNVRDEDYMRIFINNRSSEPALYSVVSIVLDKELGIESLKNFERHDAVLRAYSADHACYRFVHKIGIPGNFPIFKEIEWSLLDEKIRVEEGKSYPFLYELTCPGFKGGSNGDIRMIAGNIHIISRANSY